MPFFPPGAVFGSEHQSKDTAPDCVIKLIITCDGTECTGQMDVVVIETATGQVLASGKVHCTGQDEPHMLPMTTARPLGVTTALVRFRCNGEEEDGPTDMIWVRCSHP